MELDLFWLILAILLGTYGVLFGFLSRINEWYYVSFRLSHEKRRALPPGDMGWPVLGKMLSFLRAFKSSNPDNFIYNLVDRYGRTGIYKSYLFGSPSVIVCTPETCRRVLMDTEQFALGYPASTKHLTGKKSFHSISVSEHKRLRKLTTSSITGNEALAMYIEYIQNIVITSLDKWARNDKPIEFLTEMRKIAFKVITHIFLGSDSDSILGSVEKYYTDILYGLKSSAINIPGFAFHRALKARNKLLKILQTVLDERRAMRESKDKQKAKRGMIDLMMEVEDENGKKLEDADIKDLLLMFLLAGHESSAHAAMWAILYLHQHPEMLQKAKEEQEEIMKRRPSTQKGLNLIEIKQMEYLAKVIDETLRRTNLSFANFRQAKVDVTIKGYTIPKGWKVLVWNRGVHMDPENYPHPNQYDPSRWENHVAKPGAFIPFGAGPRICPGADLAKLEVSIFLHYFLLNYKLEQLNPGCRIVYLPIPKPSDNCLAKVIKLRS
ncbi:beta-amyrin 11-oxidase-like [Pistacia vera]|uniref:beta-amyrin 11-oxidase-like n=1 Tax=Pistacia vera TaxID=55513 RepID=UPI0012638299|nr:beta-amyrin 11-oxidase-like [Pistacia vera]XP_031288132.1 beta-amyrin 11-oxidase-like [Pistacia vera]